MRMRVYEKVKVGRQTQLAEMFGGEGSKNAINVVPDGCLIFTCVKAGDEPQEKLVVCTGQCAGGIAYSLSPSVRHVL